MKKVMYGLLCTVVAVLIGLLYSAIGHADRPTDEEQTILTAKNTLVSTVKIGPDRGLEEGSGFFYAPNKILTNWHVVAKADETIKLTMQNGQSCSGKVGYRDENWDLAIVTTDCTGIPLSYAAQNALVGSTVIITGNPLSFPFFTSKGVISVYNGGWMAFDAYVQHGSSGSPIVNLRGEVVGIVDALAKDNPQIGLGVPVEDIKRFLARAHETI